MTGVVQIRPLVGADLAEASALHREILDMEFLSRCGPGFMRAYYRTWVEAPGAISLVARDDTGDLLGVVLGATDPATHVRAMVRHGGARLAARLALYAVGHPSFARDLIVTRARRYVRGVVRLIASRLSRSRTSLEESPGPRVGEITHVLVRADRQGSGVGRALLDAAIAAGRAAGLDELVLVTPPDLAAGGFYRHLGWRADGEMTSRSGEAFVRYRYLLDDRGRGEGGNPLGPR
ncbi:MAG: GNAT family N-acetyltransferase [Acidimicrobiales bacterium]